MDTTEVIILNEICRICLLKADNMKGLLDPCEEVIELISKLSSILDSEIEISHTLPSFLCQNCEDKLRVSYKFNQLCQRSHQFILSCFSAQKSHPKNNELNQYIQCDNIANNSYSPHQCENSAVIWGSSEKSENKYTEMLIVIQEIRRKKIGSRDCLYCSFSSKDTRSLSIHMTRLHWKQKATWCSKCNQTVINLRHHIENEHGNEFKCPFCQKETKNTSHFIEHLACHTVDRKFVCMKCDKCFISARHLRVHFKVHKVAKELSCHLCSLKFSDKVSLSDHLKYHRKHKCKVCEEIFDHNDYGTHKCFVRNEIVLQAASASKNKNSIKICHQNDISMKALCTYCGKQFRQDYLMTIKKWGPVSYSAVGNHTVRTPSKLSVHLRMHTGEAPYKCAHCDARMSTSTGTLINRNVYYSKCDVKMTSNSTSRQCKYRTEMSNLTSHFDSNIRFYLSESLCWSHLVVHERSHTGEKPYICKFCGKGFAQSSVLQTHTKIHTGRTEYCLVCPKKFCRPSELKQHMRKHTGEKPYPCTNCEKAFIQKSHLIEHMMTHSEARPYKCIYCVKSFKQASTLRSHLRIHLGNKPFRCSQCSYECQQSNSLRDHMLQHTNDLPQPERPLKREICNERLTTIESFNSHRSTHQVTGDIKIGGSEMLQQILEQ